MSYNIEKIKLNNNIYMPSIGFGTSMVVGEECAKIVKKAIEVGYRHIDTASAYKNEKEIGKALAESDVNRKDLFITSKVWKDSMGFDNTIRSFENTLLDLGLEYIDLFLIHWPKNNDEKLNIETWQALEKLYKEGKARAIGVSNFLEHHLKIILDNCEIKPAVDQIEFHPGLMREDTRKICKENDIIVEAWSPLGKGKMLKNELLIETAKKYNKSVAQLCLKWCLQNDVIPLPKSENEIRMKENLDLFDFQISDEDISLINSMGYFDGSDMDPNSFN